MEGEGLRGEGGRGIERRGRGEGWGRKGGRQREGGYRLSEGNRLARV